MSRLLQGNPIVTATLIASITLGSMVLPMSARASAPGASAGSIQITATVTPKVRVTLGAPTVPVAVVGANEYAITLCAPQDPTGALGDGVCYTIVQQ